MSNLYILFYLFREDKKIDIYIIYIKKKNIHMHKIMIKKNLKK